MPQPYDNDEHLEALRAELRTTIVALNQLHHPVYPAPAERVAEVEAIVADLKSAISERKKLLREQATA